MSDVYDIVERLKALADAVAERDIAWHKHLEEQTGFSYRYWGQRIEDEHANATQLLDKYVEAKIKEALISYGLLVEREYGE